LGITYLINDDISTSFFVKRGYRSVFLDGDATFNANLYYGRWKDQQVSVPELADRDSFLSVQNVGNRVG